MTEFIAKSGAKIVINIGAWENAKKLKFAILRELAAAGVKMDKESEMQAFLPAVFNVEGSEAVDAALWPLLLKCTRNEAKITSQTFDTVEGRSDYYEIVWECVKVNLGPLVESLKAVLPASFAALLMGSTQKSPDNFPNAKS